MKILHVITSLQIGGAEKLVAEIVPRLRDKGNDIDVVAFDSSEPNFSNLLTDKGINVIFFGKGYYKISFIYRLGKMMQNYDIVHTHNTSPLFFVAIASLWNRKCKLVYTEHSTSSRTRSIPGFTPLNKWIYSRYNKIICVSDKAEENLRLYLSSLKTCCTIYNGVDIQNFHDTEAIEGMSTEGKTVVAMVAAFRPAKDHKTLIDAFSYLHDDKYELWLVGDGELRNEIRSYVVSKGFSKSQWISGDIETYGNIKFFGNRNDVPEILHAADIVVMSSHYEGLSLSSVEGMAVGKPFVASDVEGLHEVVNGYGILVPHEDSRALAAMINRLSNDSTYSKSVADNCWERARMFDIQKMVNGYQKVYEDLLNGLTMSEI